MQGVLQDPKVNVDLRAFLVGNDILLMSTDVAKGIKLISNAYNKGEISEKRLANSVKKILKSKAIVNLYKYLPISSKAILEKLNTPKEA